MRVLVTGGTGFIGSNLALELISHGHEVIITGHDSEQKVPGVAKYMQPGFNGIDWDSLGKLDVVFHQAAINDTTNLDAKEMFRANVDASLELFHKVIANGCQKIVYASSCATYGDVPAPYKEDGPVNPLNPYGESKVELDKQAMALAQEHPEVTIIGLRYSNVYGPREDHKCHRMSMVTQLANQMVKGDPRLFEFGEQLRDFVYVKDAVQANLCAMKATESCVVNCGSGRAVSFNFIVETLNKVLGVDRKPVWIENPYADRYQIHTECDMSKAREKIGFVPAYSVEEGIKDYYSSGL